MSGSCANAQGATVLSLAAVNGPGISEIEFTIQRSSGGTTAVFSARPDIVASVSNGVAGVYVVTLSQVIPTSTNLGFPVLAGWGIVRGGAGTARAVQMRNDSDESTINLLVTDTAGALVNLANSEGFHVVLRFRRDGAPF